MGRKSHFMLQHRCEPTEDEWFGESMDGKFSAVVVDLPYDHYQITFQGYRYMSAPQNTNLLH